MLWKRIPKPKGPSGSVENLFPPCAVSQRGAKRTKGRLSESSDEPRKTRRFGSWSLGAAGFKGGKHTNGFLFFGKTRFFLEKKWETRRFPIFLRPQNISKPYHFCDMMFFFSVLVNMGLLKQGGYGVFGISSVMKKMVEAMVPLTYLKPYLSNRNFWVSSPKKVSFSPFKPVVLSSI